MPGQDEAHAAAIRIARERLRTKDPFIVALKSDTRYERGVEGQGTITLQYWGSDYQVSYPDFSICEASTGRTASEAVQLILLHYLDSADGTPLADHWIAFRELPDALAYDSAFQARGSVPLARTYGRDLEGFVAASEALGGERLSFGDAAFIFRLLPRIRLAVVLHLADEEFSAAATVLFDASAGHYLPTEDLAVLGGMFCGALLKQKSAG